MAHQQSLESEGEGRSGTDSEHRSKSGEQSDKSGSTVTKRGRVAREHSSVRGEDDAFSAQRLVLNTTTGRSRTFLQRGLYLQESFHSETMGIAQREWQCEL